MQRSKMMQIKYQLCLLLLSSVYLQSLHAEEIQCNADDTKYWRTGGGFFEFNDTAQEAAVRWVQRGRTDFTGTGEVYFNDYTASCQVCFEDLLQCVFDVCKTDCLNAAFQLGTQFKDPECELCADVNCRGNFTDCSSFDVKVCKGCTKPVEEDLTAVYAGVAGAAVMVIAAFVGYKVYMSYKNAPDTEDRANNALKDMGLLVEVKAEDLMSMPPPKSDIVPMESVRLPQIAEMDEFPDNFENFDTLDEMEFGTTPETMFPNTTDSQFIPEDTKTNLDFDNVDEDQSNIF